MTENILIAPHNDDETLFCSYIIMRYKPLVYVVYDGYQHQRKFGIPIEQRREETSEAMKILGAEVRFFGLSDEENNDEKVRTVLSTIYFDGSAFIPRLQGGNPQHDIVSNVGTELWEEVCRYYSTYAKNNLKPEGEAPITPTLREFSLKQSALKCYTSQINLNKAHFDAVADKPEYISFEQC
jgi:LmbE family N-acetylglucosaminyl deacetylase